MLSLSELQAQAFPARALVFVLRLWVLAEALRLSRDRAHDIARDEPLDCTWKQRPLTRSGLHDFAIYPIDPSGLLAPESQ